MECVPTESPPSGGGRYRWAFFFRIGGDLRFISHHDTLRMLRRALARAELPVRFSEGFNPHPKVMIPLPRPVGVASHDEVVVVETHSPIDPADAVARLQRCTPQGLTVHAARPLATGESAVPLAAEYLLETDGRPSDELTTRVNELRSADAAVVTRTDRKSGKSRPVDIRPSIEKVEVVENGVRFKLRMGRGGAAKPAEVAGWIGFDPAAINHRITRLNVEWQWTS